LLVGVRAVSRPPAAMIGRRSADQVLTPRVRAVAAGALAAALVTGAILLKVLRTEGFQEQPAAVTSTPATPEPPPMTVALEEPLSTLDSTRALRAADRGRRLLDGGQVKAAVALLADAAATLPDNAELAHTYGAALWRFDARDRALFQFRRALKLSPDNELYRQDLSRALVAMGLTAEAAHLLQGRPPLVPDGLAGGVPGLPPSLPGEAVNLGGAGNGSFKGRRTFTDDDLRGGRVETPAPAPMPTPTPEPFS
jgi:hypothetical protein